MCDRRLGVQGVRPRDDERDAGEGVDHDGRLISDRAVRRSCGVSLLGSGPLVSGAEYWRRGNLDAHRLEQPWLNDDPGDAASQRGADPDGNCAFSSRRLLR